MEEGRSHRDLVLIPVTCHTWLGVSLELSAEQAKESKALRPSSTHPSTGLDLNWGLSGCRAEGLFPLQDALNWVESVVLLQYHQMPPLLVIRKGTDLLKGNRTVQLLQGQELAKPADQGIH